MAEHRNLDPLRRLNLHVNAAGTRAAGSMWTTLWTWLAAIVAAVVVLGLVFGYSRSDLARNQPAEPTTTGSAATGPAATGSASSAPQPASHLGDAPPANQ